VSREVALARDEVVEIAMGRSRIGGREPSVPRGDECAFTIVEPRVDELVSFDTVVVRVEGVHVGPQTGTSHHRHRIHFSPAQHVVLGLRQPAPGIAITSVVSGQPGSAGDDPGAGEQPRRFEMPFDRGGLTVHEVQDVFDVPMQLHPLPLGGGEDAQDPTRGTRSVP
jgi:hypothetical protein